MLSVWSRGRGSPGLAGAAGRAPGLAGACPHCSIPVLTWKASPSPRVACCKGDTALSTPCPGPPAPPWGPGGAARAQPVPRVETQPLWVQQLCPATLWSSCWWPVPTTLLISLCLSLLTISSSTSPSPLMSLQDKQRPRSREGTGKFLQLQKCWADEPPGKASADPPLTLYFVTLFFYQA